MLLGLICVLQFLPLKLFASDTQGSYKKRINEFSHLGKDQWQVSVLVTRVDQGSVLYEDHSDRSLIPASITKLFTSVAALDHFGVDHKFNTDFYYDGTFRGGVISGNIYVKGGGDPYLVNEDLWGIASDLKNLGVRDIKGKLIVDNELFSQVYWGEERRQGKTFSNNAYNAPISAFSVNFNTFGVVVAPAEKVGTRAYVNIDPFTPDSVKVVNRVRTVPANSKKNILVSRKTGKDGIEYIHVGGSIPLGHKIKKVYRSVSRPVFQGAMQMKKIWAQVGIHTPQKVEAGKTPQSAKHLYTYKSRNLSKIVKGLNLYSNNFIGDTLLFHFDPTGKLKTIDKGIAHMGSILNQRVGLRGLKIFDGSGLNSDNRVSAKEVVTLLEYAAKRFDLFPEFIASLPVANLTGSLKNRFSDSALLGAVRAKTGTLTTPVMVSSMAGYFYAKKYGLCAFAIIQNSDLKQRSPSIVAMRKSQELGLERLLHLLQ